MNVYKIERADNHLDYEANRSHVVLAESDHAARRLAAGVEYAGSGNAGFWFADTTTVELITPALDALTERIILTSTVEAL